MADNASITILRNTQANINAEPIKDGNILFTTDQTINAIYTDVGTRRIKIGGTVDVDTTLSTTSTNPVQNKVITNSINDVRGQIHTNLLNPTAQTQTIYGVTFTNNGDGTYTVNGTASNNVYYPLADQFTNLVLSRKYKLVGCPKGGSENTYLLYDDKNAGVGDAGRDAGNGSVYTPTNQPKPYIRVLKGTTVNNLLFKPMITTDLSATYDDFVQYSGDGELNENVAEIYKVSDRVSYETHTNLLNPTAQTQTINGVTFTSNGDGTYTVNGTATAYTFLNLNYVDMSTLSVPIGTYKLTGAPSNNGGVKLQVLAQNSVEIGADVGSGVIFTVPQDATASWGRITITKGSTCNNLLFKPMVTTDLSATYDDFVPYTGDSGRLNEDVANLKEKLNNKADQTSLDAVSNKVNNLEPTKFTSLSPYLDRCSIVSGGYSVNGNIAYIDVIVTLKVATDYTNQAILQGLPMPKNRDWLPISGMAVIPNTDNSELSFNGYITPSNISTNPLLAIPYAIKAGATVHFTGQYIVSQS